MFNIVNFYSAREDFRSEELDIILKTMRLNMVMQNSADRQQMITVLKKMILRIKAAMVTSCRHPNQTDSKIKGSKLEESKTEVSKTIQNEFGYFPKNNSYQNEDGELREKYVSFIRGLFVFFSSCLFEGASFSKRSIALECLQDITLHMNDHVRDLKTQETAEKLIQCFHDSFENNKNIALEILKTFPDDVTRLKDADYVKGFLEMTLQLTRSHKPPDSISAGCHVKVRKKEFIINVF